MFKLFSKEKKVRPNHIAIVAVGKSAWAEKNKVELEKAYEKTLVTITDISKAIVERKIPILTIYLIPTKIDELIESEEIMKILTGYFSDLAKDQTIHDNKVRVSVLGKWYNLPSKLVDSIKKVTQETKDYDQFFLNFCMNYEGKQEILDAIKIIGLKIRSGEINVDEIKASSVKENLYSSYFVPPDIIIINGKVHRNYGLLLWDSANSHIFFTDKLMPDFSEKDLDDAIDEFGKSVE